MDGKTLGKSREDVYFHFKGHDVTTPQSAGSITDNNTLQSIFFLVVFSINIDIQGVKKDIALRGVPDFKVIRLKEGEGESSELAGLGFKLNP